MHIEEEFLGILLSWAVYLSPYSIEEVPEFRYESHSFFVENVCGGKECNVLGWYNDQGIIYLDQDMSGSIQDQIVLHEIIHYLQHKQGDFDTHSCEDSVKREREAYKIQARYSIEMGHLPLRMSPFVYCKKPDAQEILN